MSPAIWSQPLPSPPRSCSLRQEGRVSAVVGPRPCRLAPRRAPAASGSCPTSSRRERSRATAAARRWPSARRCGAAGAATTTCAPAARRRPSSRRLLPACSPAARLLLACLPHPIDPAHAHLLMLSHRSARCGQVPGWAQPTLANDEGVRLITAGLGRLEPTTALREQTLESGRASGIGRLIDWGPGVEPGRGESVVWSMTM